ncbi:IclR family transcriptional regulator [Sinosporangium siamense]|uniref:IclR family transcriptional regulator n=1 Tax=Sinosporangium siamense TaxID=1367973 RepID=UPI0019511D9D|nr:IclR family transcriptional regulator [Sinosporangium siamense]
MTNGAHEETVLSTQTVPVQAPSSLEKAIIILTSLSTAARPMSLAELARNTGLPKTTAYRLLNTLCRNGLTRRIGIDYTVGDHLHTLAAPAPRVIPGTRRLVLPHLLRLYEITRQTVNLGVARGLEVHYLERVYGHGRVTSPSDGVDRAPLHCTAVGKVLLAFDHDLNATFRRKGALARMTRHTVTRFPVLDRELHQVRRQGAAYSREEFAGGVACVAAPVFGADGKICMALGLAAPSTLSLTELVGVARRTANALSTVVLKLAPAVATDPALSGGPGLFL